VQAQMRHSAFPLLLTPLVIAAVIGYAAPTADPPPPVATAAAPATSPAPTETRLRRGETPERALVRNGFARAEAAAVARTLHGVDMRHLRVGERVVIDWRPDGSPEAITYWRSPAERYEIVRDDDGWVAHRVVVPITVRIAAVQGALQDSLFASMERLGESPGLTAKLVTLFEWDFDFAADSLPGDRFRLLVEKRYAGDHFVGDGDILIGQYATAGRAVLTGVAYRDADGDTAYYDAAGRSVRKMFLRAPLDFTRITSGFSHARRHPILGGLRPHLAVDYGAPVGTPVRAVADGVVESAGWAGGYGLSITLRHARGYQTMYNHLSRLNVHRGARVKQRQVIGRVGSTGLSTGPHLDYRVIKSGHFVNPLGEKFIPGAPIPPQKREAFQAHVRALLERLDRETESVARVGEPG
jgi:murein DD-endopeptidase MepM/ murein hydrolase activator NlpD